MKTTPFLLILIFALLGSAPGDDLPARPSRLIHDPEKFLTIQESDAITSILERHAIDNETEVFLVITPPPLGTGDEDFARALGEAWSTKDWGVVLSYPDQIGPLVLVAGGDSLTQLRQNAWQKELAKLRNLSSQNWTPKDNMRVASFRLAEMISFAKNLPKIIHGRQIKVRQERNEENIRTHKEHVLLRSVLIGGGVLIFLILLIPFLIWRKRKRPHLFPEVHFHPRLGAQHSGGSDLCRRFPNPPA
ncbi:MAG: hypothetical protein ACSHYF_03370 [Verrucomicrobiaceae bacterium]